MREGVTEVLSIGTVDYWAIWSEPNWLFGGTRYPFEEVVKRTVTVMRSIDPKAKILGPSAGSFVDKAHWINQENMSWFLNLLSIRLRKSEDLLKLISSELSRVGRWR